MHGQGIAYTAYLYELIWFVWRYIMPCIREGGREKESGRAISKNQTLGTILPISCVFFVSFILHSVLADHREQYYARRNSFWLCASWQRDDLAANYNYQCRHRCRRRRRRHHYECVDADFIDVFEVNVSRHSAHRIPYDKNSFHRCGGAFKNTRLCTHTQKWFLLLRTYDSNSSLRMHLQFVHLQLIFIFQRIPSHNHNAYRRSFAVYGKLYDFTHSSFSCAILLPPLFRAYRICHRLTTYARTHTLEIIYNTHTHARTHTIETTDRPSDQTTVDVDDTCTRAYINIFVDVSQTKCKIKKSQRTYHILSMWSGKNHHFDCIFLYEIAKMMCSRRNIRNYFAVVH